MTVISNMTVVSSMNVRNSLNVLTRMTVLNSKCFALSSCYNISSLYRRYEHKLWCLPKHLSVDVHRPHCGTILQILARRLDFSQTGVLINQAAA